jgi:hypothetical protein
MFDRAKLFGFICALALIACGSDDKPKPDAGAGGAAGLAAKGGSGGSTAGASGATAGRRSPLSCDQRSSMPVQCGGQTCPTKTEFEQDPCFIPCCVTAAGGERCGFRGTSAAFSTECVLPAVADSSCDDVPQFQGCCEETQHVCGIIGGFAPGCQTKSSFVTLPKNPKPCGRGDSDAGTDRDASAP